jgi:hypothetical protein
MSITLVVVLNVPSGSVTTVGPLNPVNVIVSPPTPEPPEVSLPVRDTAVGKLLSERWACCRSQYSQHHNPCYSYEWYQRN